MGPAGAGAWRFRHAAVIVEGGSRLDRRGRDGGLDVRAAGRPTLVILDNALVHSDEKRLARVKRVLFDTATRHRILLLTCHPGKWRDLGVGARGLEEIRVGA